MDYAQILGLRFAYATNGLGIEEFDFTTGVQASLDTFPSPEELRQRWRGDQAVTEESDAQDLLFPFNRELRNSDGTVKRPRYYQQIAINRSMKAVIQGSKRILITMATGTGKTLVAMQIVWKLWSTHRKRHILYLADRNILVDQAKDLTFTRSAMPCTRSSVGLSRAGRCTSPSTRLSPTARASQGSIDATRPTSST